MDDTFKKLSLHFLKTYTISTSKHFALMTQQNHHIFLIITTWSDPDRKNGIGSLLLCTLKQSIVSNVTAAGKRAWFISNDSYETVMNHLAVVHLILYTWLCCTIYHWLIARCKCILLERCLRLFGWSFAYCGFECGLKLIMKCRIRGCIVCRKVFGDKNMFCWPTD